MNNQSIALLIGINYTGQDGSLNGCINDVNRVRDMLVQKMHFKKSNITMLTDDHNDVTKLPTKRNILFSIYKLIIRARRDTSVKNIWIHYSGHGTYIQDTNSDEKDSRDECIVPLDYKQNGLISDDFLQYYLRYLPTRAFCISFFDCCHSGTILDLEYTYNKDASEFEKTSNKKMSNNIILVSGCMDNQVSMDAYNVNDNSQYTGAMTSALLSTLQEYQYTVRLKELIKGIRAFLASRNFAQMPMLTSTKEYSANILLFNKSKSSFIT